LCDVFFADLNVLYRIFCFPNLVGGLNSTKLIADLPSWLVGGAVQPLLQTFVKMILYLLFAQLLHTVIAEMLL
jgi:hypothetical protein